LALRLVDGPLDLVDLVLVNCTTLISDYPPSVC
jgi:hypothetical protein